ncbi:unnamed protein product [Macrosiphum euphorbiae]|uniref:Uncharacterized protein n=1 Tax=Macrosiphum euphorbiae TaxID=13131 RepID=A0AAV0Y3Q7_9HEMI|nr:unnamed protein product [Macrosiphum euphorbiae]
MLYDYMNCGIKITGKKLTPTTSYGKKPTTGIPSPVDVKMIEQILGDNETSSDFTWTQYIELNDRHRYHSLRKLNSEYPTECRWT